MADSRFEGILTETDYRIVWKTEIIDGVTKHLISEDCVEGTIFEKFKGKRIVLTIKVIEE